MNKFNTGKKSLEFLKKSGKPILIIAGVLLIAFLIVYISPSADEKSNDTKSTTSTADINGHHLVLTDTTFTEGGSYEQKLQIFKNEKLELEMTDQRFTLFQDQHDFSLPSVDIDTAQDLIKYTANDVTGDKIPELSFIGWSGGAHCCFTGHVIELGEEASVLWDFDTMDSSAEFVDIDKDGVMEIETSDSVFRYWHINFQDSPFPYVLLTYDEKLKKYVVDQDMMRKDPPSIEEIKDRASPWTSYSWQGSDCEGNKGECAPWAYAIYLIYSGNTKEAKQYIDLAWRDNSEFKSKEDFLTEFKETLKSSDYYSILSPGLIDLDQL